MEAAWLDPNRVGGQYGARMCAPLPARHGWRIARCWCCFILGALFGVPSLAADLQPATDAAFNHYVQLTEARMNTELESGPYLWVDAMPKASREKAYAELVQGRILVEQGHTTDNGRDLKIPSGMVHHWVALAFIPGGTLDQVLPVVQDYDHHDVIYAPDVSRSKLVSRSGNDYHVFLQLRRKAIVTVVLNTEYDIRYRWDGADRASSWSHSTRIAEVDNAGQPDERELPADDSHGYLWRLDTYWRFEQKDAGVYVQVESIGLSRGIPWLFAWLIKPLVRKLPSAVLSDLLRATRAAVARGAGNTAVSG